jgi:biopolymer transport protein ExbD
MQLEQRPVPRRRAIGLTPLIDVVFILLLFFMLASSLTRLNAVPLETSSVSGDGAGQSQSLLLRIQADGSLDLNGESLPLSGLAAALSAWQARAPTLGVVVQPADRVALQQLMQVFDALAAADVPVLRLD